MKTLVLYECEICGFESVDPEQVRACEARGAPVPLVAVGDIVLAKGGFGWFDGDSAWVSNPAAKKRKVNGRCPVTGDGNCFGLCCCFRFYYVVTLIDRDPDIGGRHRLRYHLWTKAMTGKQGYECGVGFKGFSDIQPGDQLVCYVLEKS